uniref:Uncharacterized protein n=1 Tax=Romanomermis culicivorax TaxID=13658 RepID=A0A915IGM0_ROMCU
MGCGVAQFTASLIVDHIQRSHPMLHPNWLKTPQRICWPRCVPPKTSSATLAIMSSIVLKFLSDLITALEEVETNLNKKQYLDII